MSHENDVAKLREVLRQARSADNFDKLTTFAPLLAALEESVRLHGECRKVTHDLMATLRLQVYYPHDPSMGAEAIARRWIVAKPERFHLVIERLRARFPERSEFPK